MGCFVIVPESENPLADVANSLLENQHGSVSVAFLFVGLLFVVLLILCQEEFEAMESP